MLQQFRYILSAPSPHLLDVHNYYLLYTGNNMVKWQVGGLYRREATMCNQLLLQFTTKSFQTYTIVRDI